MTLLCHAQNQSDLLFSYIDTAKSNSLGGAWGYPGGKPMAQYYTTNQAQPRGEKLPLAYLNPNVMAGVVVRAPRPPNRTPTNRDQCVRLTLDTPPLYMDRAAWGGSSPRLWSSDPPLLVRQIDPGFIASELKRAMQNAKVAILEVPQPRSQGGGPP